MDTEQKIVKYDDYAWHYRADYPVYLPKECAATHIGQFFRFCITQDLVSSDLWLVYNDELEAIKNCRMSGAQFLLHFFRGSLLSTQFNERGRYFVETYYDQHESVLSPCYLDDYSHIFHLTPLQQLYGVADSYANYYLIEDVLRHRLESFEYYNL